MGRLPVGIDNYGLYPLKLSALETLEWASQHGAEGVQFSGLAEHERKRADEGYFKAIGQFAREERLYVEWGGGQHIPYDTTNWTERDVRQINSLALREAELVGARIIRSCSGGLMRWQKASPMTETLIEATADALLKQKAMLLDHNIILAIETHFEFTTHEIRRIFERCEAEPGEWLGICLDTMNLLTMLEDPLSGTERILPWVVSTHMKDGCIMLTENGFNTFPVPVGEGIIELKRIIHRIETLPQPITLSIEDHGGSFDLPIFDPVFLSRFPDLSTNELSRLTALTQQTRLLIKEKNISATPRETWPHICEQRLKEDIQGIRLISQKDITE